jgi:hypothetical protein
MREKKDLDCCTVKILMGGPVDNEKRVLCEVIVQTNDLDQKNERNIQLHQNTCTVFMNT